MSIVSVACTKAFRDKVDIGVKVVLRGWEEIVSVEDSLRVGLEILGVEMETVKVRLVILRE